MLDTVTVMSSSTRSFDWDVLIYSIQHPAPASSSRMLPLQRFTFHASRITYYVLRITFHVSVPGTRDERGRILRRTSRILRKTRQLDLHRLLYEVT
jgi:hypothetical protein